MKSQTFSGIDVLGDMSWGSHFCQFYDTKQDLLGILIPYFKTGLQNNEFCLWITSDPIDIKEAVEELRKGVPELDRYIIEQKIEVLSHEDWYLRGDKFNPEGVFDGWNKKLNQALERGCTGMRVSGNVGWADSGVSKDFIEYERGLDRFLIGKRMIAFCTYPLKKCKASDVLDVAFAHEYAISKRNGRWEIVEVPEYKKTKAQIQILNEELEERVVERTRELAETNTALRKEIAERNHAEALLHAKEQEFRAIVENAPDHIIRYDRQFRRTYTNPAVAKAYGLSAEAVTGKPLGSVIQDAGLHVNEVELEQIRERIAAVFDTGKSCEYEMNWPLSAGRKYFSVRLFPELDLNGSVINVLAISRDITERKRAEDELHLAYQRLSYHVENTPLAVIEFDKDLFIKRWSKRAEEIFGWKESEALGKNVYDPDFRIIYEEDIPAVDKINEQLMEGIVNMNLSLNRNYTKSGSVIYSEWYNSVLKDEHGNVITLLSLVHNVTERKKADEQKEFEQRDKEALINTTDDLLWSVSTDLKLIAANKAFIRRFQDLTGVTVKPGDDLMNPDFFSIDILAFWKEVYIIALSGEAFKKEIYTPALNKFAANWTETFFNPIYKDETIVALACYSRDITERKLAEERIRLSEAHLAEAQRLAKLGSWDYDIKADRLTWSEELYNVFGTDKQIFIETHRSFLDLVDAEDREFAQQTSRHTQQTGESFTIEYHITTPKREKRVIQEHGYGQTDDNGNVVRLFGTAQDITERKKAEEELQQLNEELRSISSHSQNVLENERTAIAREIHDELGQQLTALKMEVAWLNKKLPDDPVLKDKANDILSLISEMLITIKRIAIELRPVILDHLGLIAALEWQSQEFEKRTGIKSQFHTDLKDFNADRNLATQIFRICQEAFTNVARHAQATQIETTIEEKDGFIWLVIKDNGQGFNIVEAKNKNSLGLIGMKERALMFQGELTVESERLQGAVITLKIPL